MSRPTLWIVSMPLSAFAIIINTAVRCALPAAAEPLSPVPQPGHHPQIPPLTALADVAAPKPRAASMIRPRQGHTIIPGFPLTLLYQTAVGQPQTSHRQWWCMCPLHSHAGPGTSQCLAQHTHTSLKWRKNKKHQIITTRYLNQQNGRDNSSEWLLNDLVNKCLVGHFIFLSPKHLSCDAAGHNRWY